MDTATKTGMDAEKIATKQVVQKAAEAIGNLLGYEYFLKHYKLIAIDLSKQIELENPDSKQ